MTNYLVNVGRMKVSLISKQVPPWDNKMHALKKNLINVSKSIQHI